MDLGYLSGYASLLRHEIPAKVKNEKEDALCKHSPTNVHFYGQRYDQYGNLIPLPRNLYCEVCNIPIKQKGARWVVDHDRSPVEKIDGKYTISEADDIEDLL